MADEKVTPGTETEAPPAAPPAEAPKIEIPIDGGTPGPIPYERFKEVNTELKAAQTQLTKLQEAETKRERETLSEVERLQAEKSDLEQQLATAQSAIKQAQMRDAFRAEVAKQELRFVGGAEADAFTLANLQGVEANESGAIQGMDKAVKALFKAKPYLFVQPEVHNTDGSAGTGSGIQLVDKAKKESEYTQRFGIR